MCQQSKSPFLVFYWSKAYHLRETHLQAVPHATTRGENEYEKFAKKSDADISHKLDAFQTVDSLIGIDISL